VISVPLLRAGIDREPFRRHQGRGCL